MLYFQNIFILSVLLHTTKLTIRMFKDPQPCTEQLGMVAKTNKCTKLRKYIANNTVCLLHVSATHVAILSGRYVTRDGYIEILQKFVNHCTVENIKF